jgi:hypothetical protein
MAACSNAQSTAKGGGLIENTDFFDSIGHLRHFRDVRDDSGLPPIPDVLWHRSEPTQSQRRPRMTCDDSAEHEPRIAVYGGRLERRRPEEPSTLLFVVE